MSTNRRASTGPAERTPSSDRAQVRSRDRAQTKPAALLTEDELGLRREATGDLLGAATAQAKELHRFLAGAGFAVGLVDRDGFLVELIGDRSVLERLADGGCRAGTCWSEEAIETSAVAISLARGIAVQVEDEDDYPGRMEMGRTCSAAPIFDESGTVAAVICLVGTGSRVYPHTLGMVSTAAKAIETQIKLVKRTSRFIDRSGELDNAFNSLETGVLVVDREGTITYSNPWAERVLSWMGGLKGRSLASFLGREVEIESLMRPDIGYTDRELLLKGPHRWVGLLHSLKPLADTFGRVDGLVLFFREMDKFLSLVNRFSNGRELFNCDDLIGHSKALKELKARIKEASKGDHPVLLTGEPATGRALAAQAIHTSGLRREGPFIHIDCGAASGRDQLSLIFGRSGNLPWEEGPWSRPGRLERAEGGTVYLTGLEYPSPQSRKMFLDLIRTGRIRRIGGQRSLALDLRIIIGTRPGADDPEAPPTLAEEVQGLAGVQTITVPALKDRSEDIIPLAQWLMERVRPKGPKSKLRFSAKAQTTLTGHAWPGNLTELEQVLWNAAELSPSSLIRPSHLVGLTVNNPTAIPLEHSGSILAEVERRTIEEVLSINRFNISKTARSLGITRATLYNKLKRYDIMSEN